MIDCPAGVIASHETPGCSIQEADTCFILPPQRSDQAGCSWEELLLSLGQSFKLPEVLIAASWSFFHHAAAADADGKLVFTACNILNSRDP